MNGLFKCILSFITDHLLLLYDERFTMLIYAVSNKKKLKIVNKILLKKKYLVNTVSIVRKRKNMKPLTLEGYNFQNNDLRKFIFAPSF